MIRKPEGFKQSGMFGYHVLGFGTHGCSSADTGWKQPGTMTGNTGDGPGPDWTDPDNAKLDDGSDASLNLQYYTFGKDLVATNFGFSVPAAAAITQVEVRAECFEDDGCVQGTFKLVVSGSHAGSKSTIWSFPDTQGLVTRSTDSSADKLWGNTNLTPTIVNATDFGAVIFEPEVTSKKYICVAIVDVMEVKVHYC